MGGFAWVTLATNDSYSLGALVLAHSLKRAGTSHDLVALITPGVTNVMREKLAAVFSLVQEVNILDSKDESNLRLLARPELGITFTKLHCWKLTQYEKCVFVDADALVIRNCDELFEREELSAAPDVGWPDCFNSGVFVFKPSQQTYDSLINFATSQGSFDGGDQGLLNMFFSDWSHKDIAKHLPFIYNMCSTATYSYLPAFKQFGNEVRIIHFIGSTKPWLQYFDTLTGIVQPPTDSHHIQPLLQIWWNIFCDNVHTQLNPDMATSTLAPSWHNAPSLPPITNHSRFTFQNLRHETDIDLNFNKPDFSDFKDPWDNYQPQFDAFLQISQQVNQEIFNNSEQLQRPDNSNETDNRVSHDYTKNSNQEECNRSQENNYQENCQQNNYPESYEQNNHQENYRHSYQENHYCQKNTDTNQESNCQSIESYYHSSHQELSSNQEKFCCQYQESQIDQEHNFSGGLDDHNQSQQQQESCNDERFFESQKNMSREIFETGEKLTLMDDLKIDEQTDNHHTISSHPFNIRIIPNKVAPQSEPTNIEEHLESNDTGLAGALAQLTLGEARSNEQVAFEEHMRKQSWEQGQIDYLGRDSFDNIWKKISETLATQPEREETPPLDQLEIKKIEESPVVVKSEEVKEPAVTTKEKETTDQKEPSAVSLPITTDIQESVPIVVSQIIEPVVEKKEDPAPISKQVQQIPTSVPVVPLLETSIIPSEVPESVVNAEQQIREFAIPQETISKEPVICQIPDLQPAEAQETSVQEKPVPIQVAESVLQAEPKESVSHVTSPVGEEAISSIVSVVQESALAVTETLISPPSSDIVPKMENGCADHPTEILTPIASPAATVPESLVQIQQEVKEVVQKAAEIPAECKESTAEVPQPPKEEKSESNPVTEQEKTSTKPEEPKEKQKESPESAKPKEAKLERRKSSSMEKPLLPSCEPKLTVQIPQSKPSEISGIVQKPREERKKSLSSSTSSSMEKSTESETPERPTRSKEIKVPPTPTVTEATPPTSPPINPDNNDDEESKATKKIVKKVVKKQSTEESEDAADTGESSTKKVTKKVVKKVVKKKESTEADGSKEKVKKIVKKSSSSQLETDKSVPETPPPGSSSDVPVPPKRKVKPTPTTKGTTSKKSDTEL
ncbi:uncharacterized protein DDB_G0284459 isoform X2 [Leptopilina heterotoma]|uniref:uncharacterized protein DDB_G0284459 isoform X2 n=1 Tax=Leptopilina heterotoma TaxID=63436 RepID=UPI001CAA40A4|nr:uncharacterized protein DDB_G0284459 isoform X2 [Leptopilina heterotoma]